MSKTKEGSKITLGMIKGKSIQTSVPTISIRFNANAEEIEELYQSDDEHVDKVNNEKNRSPGIADPETSPLRYLPRIGKRSTSVDTSLATQDSSPPSDRWKFITGIKGKIAKGVEEIKHRNQESEITLKKPKITKDKDNSSLSDSDMSESSISKTCGVSTTEGVEMSSEDDAPSLENEKGTKRKLKDVIRITAQHHRNRLIRKRKSHRNGKIAVEKLSELYEITTGTKPNLVLDNGIVSNENVEVESGVEALEDEYPQNVHSKYNVQKTKTTDTAVSDLVKQIDNVEIGEDNVVNILPVVGSTIQHQESERVLPRTYLVPHGFVDLRRVPPDNSLFNTVYSFRYIIVVCAIAVLHIYTILPANITSFFIGVLSTILFNYIFTPFFGYSSHSTTSTPDVNQQSVIEIPAVKEHRPFSKIEGWMNEYPDVYNPETYHISQTQSVYIKLQGNLLRISHTKTKIPKRELWNETLHKHILFTDHRVYNLLGASVTLLPEELNRRRLWSKKYPICITFNSANTIIDTITDEEEGQKQESVVKKQKEIPKKKLDVETQVFSKLEEEQETLSMDYEEYQESMKLIDEDGSLSKEDEDDETFSLYDWGAFLSPDSPKGTQIFLFGRSSREKEDWFRYFKNATHKEVDYVEAETDGNGSISDTLLSRLLYEQEYSKFMSMFQKLSKEVSQVDEFNPTASLMWINAILSRICFDFTHEILFTQKVQERIQRKLNSIKLPYFVEQLTCTELNLGNTAPLVLDVTQPKFDQRGLWIDLDAIYEGHITLKLQTKLNLMKLKHNTTPDNAMDDSLPAKWQCSDVDDTAESSSDDDPGKSLKIIEDNAKLATTAPSSNSKKLIKMMDKIAESKLFQAAAENRYIKKAMEGVSNTDLFLKVDIKYLKGTLVINMPPPPSDRMWFGFRALPKLLLNAQPIVGDRNMSFLKHLSNWIEKKLILEFQKAIVLPNMEDLVIPVMTSKLPM